MKATAMGDDVTPNMYFIVFQSVYLFIIKKCIYVFVEVE